MPKKFVFAFIAIAFCVFVSYAYDRAVAEARRPHDCTMQTATVLANGHRFTTTICVPTVKP